MNRDLPHKTDGVCTILTCYIVLDPHSLQTLQMSHTSQQAYENYHILTANLPQCAKVIALKVPSFSSHNFANSR